MPLCITCPPGATGLLSGPASGKTGLVVTGFKPLSKGGKKKKGFLEEAGVKIGMILVSVLTVRVEEDNISYADIKTLLQSLRPMVKEMVFRTPEEGPSTDAPAFMLPEGWQASKDQSTGRTFYVNPSRMLLQWERPRLQKRKKYVGGADSGEKLSASQRRENSYMNGLQKHAASLQRDLMKRNGKQRQKIRLEEHAKRLEEREIRRQRKQMLKTQKGEKRRLDAMRATLLENDPELAKHFLKIEAGIDNANKNERQVHRHLIPSVVGRQSVRNNFVVSDSSSEEGTEREWNKFNAIIKTVELEVAYDAKVTAQVNAAHRRYGKPSSENLMKNSL